MHNLNDNVTESFQFELDGKTYTMKYPTMEELEAVQDIVKKEEDSDKVMDYMYGFITGEPDIKKTLKKQNIKVIQNFNKMVRTEFGIEE